MLPKLRVAGSSPVCRSKHKALKTSKLQSVFNALFCIYHRKIALNSLAFCLFFQFYTNKKAHPKARQIEYILVILSQLLYLYSRHTPQAWRQYP